MLVELDAAEVRSESQEAPRELRNFVNNAANPLALPIGSISADALRKSYETNVRGPPFLVQAALPHLRSSEHASVINVITAGIFTHGAYVSMYVAAKSALRSVTRSMAAEFASDQIRVNALAPGTVRTGMVPGMLFLASDASSFMTGQTLVLDGGMTVY